MTRDPETPQEEALMALALSEAQRYTSTHCHECGIEVPPDAKRCYVFNHPFCAPCWDKLLPPDPEDYHRMMDEALKPSQLEADIYADYETSGPGWPD